MRLVMILAIDRFHPLQRGIEHELGKAGATEAFTLAFNQIVAQRALMESAPDAVAAPSSAPAAIVAVDTVMRATPAVDGAEVRKLRAGTELRPIGERTGLFLEVEDNFGSSGWVSIEDLN